MAKDRDTVEVPAGEYRQLLARLEALEHADRVRQTREQEGARAVVLDEAWEARQAELQKTTAQRTQAIADRRWGTQGPRWRVCLVSVPESEGASPPDISEVPTLLLSANSPEEAEVRFLKVCGIIRHEHRVEVAPVATEPHAA